MRAKDQELLRRHLVNGLSTVAVVATTQTTPTTQTSTSTSVVTTPAPSTVLYGLGDSEGNFARCVDVVCDNIFERFCAVIQKRRARCDRVRYLYPRYYQYGS